MAGHLSTSHSVFQIHKFFFQGDRSRQCFPDIRENTFVGVGISSNFSIIPILPDLKKSPKLLWIDTGLVNYVAGMQEDLLFSKDSDELWNGDIAEHIVGQELLGSTFMFGEKRMFWVREARNSQAEIDFLIRYKSHLIPIEVKTGSNAKLRSLHLFMEESKEKVALRLWNGPMTSDTVTTQKGKSFTLYNIPLYYAGYLQVFLDRIRDTHPCNK